MYTPLYIVILSAVTETDFFLAFLDIDDCNGHACVNGATCVDQVNYYECLCPTGFDGPFCQNSTFLCC